MWTTEILVKAFQCKILPLGARFWEEYLPRLVKCYATFLPEILIVTGPSLQTEGPSNRLHQAVVSRRVHGIRKNNAMPRENANHCSLCDEEHA